MKSFYIVLAIIIFLSIGWVCVSNFLNSNILELNTHISSLQNSLDNNDWEEVNSLFSTISLKWNSFKKPLMTISNHDEIEKVNLSLLKIDNHIKSKELFHLNNEISSLKHFINNIKDKESLSLYNIF